MLRPEDLKVEHYTDSLMRLFSDVAKEAEFRPHPKILMILNILRDWFEKHKENVAAQQRGDVVPAPQQDKSQYQQTPLHLLSQVATGNQAQMSSAEQRGPQAQHDWTFTSPTAVDYSRRHHGMDPRNEVTYAQSSEAPQTGGLSASQQQLPYPDAYIMAGSEEMGEFGWGSNFEQAMDMALGGMDGLQGGGLDGWFLGDSMAPFQFTPGEMPNSGQPVAWQ